MVAQSKTLTYSTRIVDLNSSILCVQFCVGMTSIQGVLLNVGLALMVSEVNYEFRQAKGPNP